MAYEYQAPRWQEVVMSWHDPHRRLEPLTDEIAAVEGALETLVEADILPHKRYDRQKMLAHRRAVQERFDVPWTAISHRMQRLLYAINAVAQPQVMVAVGIFCGNTYISNAGAAVGPGACYQAKRLVGIELRPSEADRARRNVAALGDTTAPVEILGTDGIPWLRACPDPIDLLYLDADGPGSSAKSIYLDMLQAALPHLQPGSLVLAHNSVNAARSMADYLRVVRDPFQFQASANMVVDDQGLEVSRR